MAAKQQSLIRWPTWLAAAWFALFAFGNLCGQERPVWKTGPALRQQLDASIGITWGERPARDGLANLAATTGVAIFLDRRLDPDQKLDVKLADLPLQTVLERVAGGLQGGVSLVGSVVYIGPKETSGKLATIAAIKRQQAGQLPNEAKARLLKGEAWQWGEPAEPRKLLDELAARAGMKVLNPELIPFDLWPAADWPVLPWTDRLTLLLAGFGLSFEIDANPRSATEGVSPRNAAVGGPASAIRLVPLPEKLTFEKVYAARGEPAKAAADLSKVFPGAKIVVESGKLRILATAEEHDLIDRLLRGEKVKTTKPAAAQKRYSLTVEQQAAGNVVKTITNQLGIEMKYEPVLTAKLQAKVSFVVKDVTLEELLEKTLGPLGLAYKLDDQTLEVVPAE